MPAQPPAATAPDAGDFAAPSTRISLAAATLANGDAAGARAVLDALIAAHPVLPREAANEIAFLYALIDIEQHALRPAIATLRRLLAANPRAARLRLELARALYLAHQYQAAEHQFRLARAGRIPAAVRANIDGFLAAIHRDQRFGWTFSLSLLADSNRNSATASDTISLFGLPFQLSGDSRRSAGVGMVIDAGAEWTNRPGHRWRWRNGIALHRAQYGATRYDDMVLTAYSGPRMIAGHWDLGLTAVASRRWYGDRVYADARGGAVDATYALSSRAAITGALVVNDLKYAIDPVQDGTGGEASLGLTVLPDPGSAITLTGAALVQHAGDAGYASGGARAGISAMHDFPGGISLRLSSAYTRIGYDGVLDLFGVRRIDRQTGIEAALTHRGLAWRGLVPQFTFAYTRNASTIALYRFARTRVGIGIARAF